MLILCFIWCRSELYELV